MLQKPSNVNRLWTLMFETQVKEGTCCCFGFKVEKEQVRLALEEQALPISSHFSFYIDVSSALEDTKGLLWIGKAKEKARLEEACIHKGKTTSKVIKFPKSW